MQCNAMSCNAMQCDVMLCCVMYVCMCVGWEQSICVWVNYIYIYIYVVRVCVECPWGRSPSKIDDGQITNLICVCLRFVYMTFSLFSFLVYYSNYNII